MLPFDFRITEIQHLPGNWRELVASPVPSEAGSSNQAIPLTISSAEAEAVSGWFKPCSQKYTPELAELEASMSIFYRLLIGKQAADVRLVRDGDGGVIGVFSVELPRFVAFAKQLNELNLDRLLSLHVMDMLVASQLAEEDDLHPDNAGTADWDGDMRAVRIDFDMSAMRLEYKRRRFRMTWDGYKPELTRKDIKNFPCVEDALPCYWPTYFPKNDNFRRSYGEAENVFRALAKSDEATNQKYTAYLRYLLIDDQLLEQSIKVRVGDTAVTRKIIEHFKERKESLYQILMKMTSFRRFLRNQGIHAWQEIQSYFHWYNREIANNGSCSIEVKYAQLRLEAIWQDVFVLRLQLALQVLQKTMLSGDVTSVTADEISSLNDNTNTNDISDSDSYMDDLHELEFSRVTDIEMSILIFPKKMEGTDSTFDDDDVVHVLKLEDLREWEQLLRVYNELVVWVKRNGQKDFTSLDEASQQLRAIYESLLELLPSLKVKVGEGHALVKLIEDSIACYVRDLLSCPNVNHMGVARLDLECFSMAQMTHSILLPAPSDGDFIRHNKASLMRFFQAWLNDIDNKINVIEAVREAYDEYRSFFREMLNWQRPESDVAGLLLQFEQDKINGTELVLELTHRGGWETESSIRVSKSLNVLIIELLCKKCQQIYRERAGYSKADQLADSNLITKISPDSFKQVARVLREELNRLSTLTASVKV